MADLNYTDVFERHPDVLELVQQGIEKAQHERIQREQERLQNEAARKEIHEKLLSGHCEYYHDVQVVIDPFKFKFNKDDLLYILDKDNNERKSVAEFSAINPRYLGDPIVKYQRRRI
jgi:hypothetical protein